MRFRSTSNTEFGRSSWRHDIGYDEGALHLALWDAPAGSPRADRLEVLVLLAEAFERAHYPVADPDPIHFFAAHHGGARLFAQGP